jgi:hypothetical protein
MTDPVVIVGMGQMGGVFAHGLLRAGHPVEPVTRQRPIVQVSERTPEPLQVVVAVGEQELGPVLEQMPPAWKSRVVLVQNELLPPDWRSHGIEQPSVTVAWFEKKSHTPLREVVPSVVSGPGAAGVATALEGLGLHVRTVEPGEALELELVTKNLYILTTNIAGLELGGGTVSQLWGEHRELAEEVARDVLELQEGRLGRALPRQRLLDGMVQAFDADPQHGCKGRSAPGRLERALRQADDDGLAVPRLRRIAAGQGGR